MRCALILNPACGPSGSSTEQAGIVLTSLKTSGMDVLFLRTTEERPAAVLAKECIERDFEKILVAGGDGTVREVAEVIAGSGSILGIIPLGTWNNVSRALNIPREPSAACQVALSGRETHMDMGRANGRAFFEAAGCGLDASLFPAGEEFKSGQWTSLWEVACRTLAYKPCRFKIDFGSEVHEAKVAGKKYRLTAAESASTTLKRRALVVVAANGPYYGGALTVAPAADVRDGRLTLTIFRGFSKMELIRHFFSISSGRYQYSPKIETFSVRSVKISTRNPVPCHADGEPLGMTPLHLEAVPRALRVMIPR